MSDLKTLQATHFLTYDFWTSAKKLLEYQISDKPHFKTYNTLNFFYFDKIRKWTKKVGTKKYYKERVANNLFYGLEYEFFFLKYTVPKTGIGLRNYNFFSYPMQQLLYAYGLYLLRTTQQFLIDKKSEKIKSFYGGGLKFDDATNMLVLNFETTLYYIHYNRFKDELKKETLMPDNKIVIRLDIQDYFDNISIAQLLNLISEFVKPSDKKIYNFDSSTKEQIEFFFRFLGNGVDNIPQSDNNIISNFISYLYLTFGDLIIEDTILNLDKEYAIIKDYKIIRYVDDIYLSLEFNGFDMFDSSYTVETRNAFLYLLLNTVADEFYNQLNLRFNGKAELFHIEEESERKKLLDYIKKVSEDYPDPSSGTKMSVPDKVNRLLGRIDSIKRKDIAEVYKELPKEESETLKDIYDKDVLGLLSTTTNLKRLEKRLADFNFDLLRVSPQPLIIMITLCKAAKERFENYLTAKGTLTTFDRSLLVTFLCQSGFSNLKLIEKLRANGQLKPILGFMKRKKVVSNSDIGYYNVDWTNLVKLSKQVSFTEQIRLRVYTERQGLFSIALNHLLNEIHLACCLLEGKDIKHYAEPDIRAFLTAKGLDHKTKSMISNLFNRRNSNPISHPGSDSRVAWAVEESEYKDFKSYVGKAFESITR